MQIRPHHIAVVKSIFGDRANIDTGDVFIHDFVLLDKLKKRCNIICGLIHLHHWLRQLAHSDYIVIFRRRIVCRIGCRVEWRNGYSLTKKTIKEVYNGAVQQPSDCGQHDS